MPINWKAARKLCTTQEFAIVEATRRGVLETLTPSILKREISRARKLLGKWRDAEKKLGRGARGRGKAKPAAPRGAENTSRKRALFEEVLKRFEDRLAALEEAAKPKISSVADKRTGRPKSVRRKLPKTAGKGAAKGKVSKAGPVKSARKTAAEKRARYAEAGSKRTLAHVSSRAKRSQGKRDARTARGRGG